MTGDLRYALRRIAQAPAFAAVVVLLLALGTGANTALFTVANALLLTPRPGVHDADRLVWVAPADAQTGRRARLSYADIARLSGATRVLESAAGFDDSHFTLSGRGDPERVRGQFVAGDYFATLRATPLLGRMLRASDDAPGAELAVVISHSLWQRRFAGDVAVVGRLLTINGRAATIVGVAPPLFNGADLELRRDVWLPFATWQRALPFGPRTLADVHGRYLEGVARLRDGVAPATASAALGTLLARAEPSDTAARFSRVNLPSAASGIPAGALPQIIPMAGLAVAVTLTVLLIVCANVGNLLLARGIVRRREIGVRLALGAARRRVVRQLVVESAILALAGTVGGVILALWIADAIVGSGLLPLPLAVGVDPRVLGVAAAIAGATTIVMGVVPALDATRADVATALRSGAPGLDRRRRRLQGRLVAAQVALSVMLLATAALFLRALQKERRFALGFDASASVLALSFDPAEAGYSRERSDAILSAVRDGASRVPGVGAVAFTDQLPMGERFIFESMELADTSGGRPSALSVFRASVDPEYLSILRIPLVAGRGISPRDDAATPLAVVVSEELARRAWPGRPAVGQQFRLGDDDPRTATVVGVARDAFVLGMEDTPRPILYLPRAQDPRAMTSHLVVRTTGDAARIAPQLVRLVSTLAPDVPVSARTMADYRDENLGKPRNASILLSIVGALALSLAAIGLYAVIAFAIGQRSHEIGVRLALGARREQVVALFVRGGVRVVAIGAGVGLALAIALARVLAAALPEVAPGDWVACLAVLAALVPIAVVASWLPARRAASVDPSVALRSE